MAEIDLIPPGCLLLRMARDPIPGGPVDRIVVPAGPCLADLALAYGPGWPLDVWGQHGTAALTLPGCDQVMEVERRHWLRVRPRAGAVVTLGLAPGDNETLQIAALIAITVAAVAISGGLLGPAVAGGAAAGGAGAGIGIGAFGSAFAAGGWAAIATSAALATLGPLAIQRLIPVQPDEVKQADSTETYLITGGGNALLRDGDPVPLILGRIRVTPPLGAQQIIEVEGNETWVRFLYIVGYGPLSVTAPMLGDRPLEDVEGAEGELRAGYPDDPPLTLFSGTPDYDPIGIEIRKDDDPVYRYTTAAGVNEASVIVQYPIGLWGMTDGTMEVTDRDSWVGIRWRPIAGGAWTEAEAILENRSQSSAFLVVRRIVFPAAGTYEIEVYKTSDDDRENTTEKVMVYAIQSISYRDPVTFDVPVCRIAARFKSSATATGELAAFSVLAESVLPDWDAEEEAWIAAPTRNPAALARAVRKGHGSYYRAADDELLEADWQAAAVAATAAGAIYDAEIRDRNVHVWELGEEILAAMRARPYLAGDQVAIAREDWTRPLDDVISTADSRSVQMQAQVRDVPEVLRVTFVDATNDYRQSTRLVTRRDLMIAAGIAFPTAASDEEHAATVEAWLGRPLLPEPRTYRGWTDPARVWHRAQVEMGEELLRSRTLTVTKGSDAAAYEPGMHVEATIPWAEVGRAAGRVRQVLDPRILILDRPVEQVAGHTYRLRLRRGPADLPQVALVTQPGRATRVTLAEDLEAAAGDVWTIDEVGSEAIECVVLRVEPDGGWGGKVILQDWAPELSDWWIYGAAEWRGRAAPSEPLLNREPAVPRIVGIQSGTGIAQIEADGTIRDRVAVSLSPGTGSRVAPTDSFEVRWRYDGADWWQPTQVVPAVAGEVWFSGPSRDDEIEVQARALSARRRPSAWGDAIAHTVGTRDLPPPDPTSLTVSEGVYGRRSYQPSARPADVGFAGWVYRARSGSDPAWLWDDLTLKLTDDEPVLVAPWESWQPLEAGTWTVGVATVSTTGVLCEEPYLAVITLSEAVDPDQLLSRSERAAGWDGVQDHCSGTVDSDLVFSGVGGEGTLGYTTPALGLGRLVNAANVIADLDATGTVTLEMQSSTTPMAGAWGPVGAISGPARYVAFRITGGSGEAVSVQDLNLFIRRTA